MLYTAKAIRKWNVDHEITPGGTWAPARPLTYWSLRRIRIAWGVLIGRYDALDWECREVDGPPQRWRRMWRALKAPLRWRRVRKPVNTQGSHNPL